MTITIFDDSWCQKLNPGETRPSSTHGCLEAIVHHLCTVVSADSPSEHFNEVHRQKLCLRNRRTHGAPQEDCIVTDRNKPTDLGRRQALKTLGTGVASAAAMISLARAGAAHAKKKTVKVEVEVGDGLKYSMTKIEVASGSQVELTLKHTGKMPKAAMGHNLVILKSGTKPAKFANAAMTAAKTEYIPAKMKDSIIAHTKLVGGGESDTITFEAPAKGTYPYLCSFPGHYSVMNGTLVVT